MRKADNLTAIYAPNVQTMWDQHLTAIRAFTVYYRGNFTFIAETERALSMKNTVFWDIRIQFVHHKEHITSPIQNPAG
jgi:hypothetical protein